MSKRARIGRKIDAARLAQLVSSPGIDPRMWCSLCIVDKVVVDGDHGVFADVLIMATATVDGDGNTIAQKETVRVAADYAGNGFGFYMPPLQGDEVLVVWPHGQYDDGGVLIKRLWSASDQPPATAKNNPNDALLMLGKDVNLRIIMQGQGNASITVDKGKVLLGGETDQALDLVALSTKADQAVATIATLLDKLFGPTAVIVTEPGNGANSALQAAGIAALAAYLIKNAATAQWLPASTAAQKVKAE